MSGDDASHHLRRGRLPAVGADGGDENQQAQHFRHLVASGPHAVFVHDGGRVMYANPTAMRWITSQTTENADENQDTEHRSLDLAALSERADSVQRGAPAAPVTVVLRRSDGTATQMQAVTAPAIWDGRPMHQTVLYANADEVVGPTSGPDDTALIGSIPDAIVATTDDGVITRWNRAAEALYGLSADDVLGRLVSVVDSALDPAAIVAQGGVVIATRDTASRFPATIRMAAAGTDSDYVVVCCDHTRPTALHYESVVTSLDRGVVVIRRDGSIASINPAAIRLLGYGARRFPNTHSERALDFPVFDADDTVVPAEQRPVNITLRTGQPIDQRVLGVRHHDGHRAWISFTTALLDPDDRDHSPVVLSMADVTNEHQRIQHLRHLAHHDGLTGLPNRSRALTLVTEALDPSQTSPLAAVMFLDIDQFKQVNDSFGHHGGDHILQVCAQRFSRALRPTDTLARVGGDEFAALICAPTSLVDLHRLARRLHKTLNDPIAVDGQPITVSTSIGVATVDACGPMTPAEFLRHADTAMYQAKANGAGTTRFHVP